MKTWYGPLTTLTATKAAHLVYSLFYNSIHPHMTSEVIVDVGQKEISIALLEDKKLVEFQKEGRSEHFSVGNIYLAKVRKLMPGLNACFVNVGYERDAFLHYLDLGTKYNALEKFMQLLEDNRLAQNNQQRNYNGAWRA